MTNTDLLYPNDTPEQAQEKGYAAVIALLRSGQLPPMTERDLTAQVESMEDGIARAERELAHRRGERLAVLAELERVREVEHGICSHCGWTWSRCYVLPGASRCCVRCPRDSKE